MQHADVAADNNVALPLPPLTRPASFHSYK